MVSIASSFCSVAGDSLVAPDEPVLLGLVALGELWDPMEPEVPPAPVVAGDVL